MTEVKGHVYAKCVISRSLVHVCKRCDSSHTEYRYFLPCRVPVPILRTATSVYLQREESDEKRGSRKHCEVCFRDPPVSHRKSGFESCSGFTRPLWMQMAIKMPFQHVVLRLSHQVHLFSVIFSPVRVPYLSLMTFWRVWMQFVNKGAKCA